MNVAQLAGELGLPVGLLLEQLQAAGLAKQKESDSISEQDRAQLLVHLRSSNGNVGSAKATITLTRGKTSSIKESDSTCRAQTKSSLVPCPHCRELVAEHNMKRHINRVHSPDRCTRDTVLEEQKRRADVVERQRAEREKHLSSEISCPRCHTKIKLKEIKSHFGAIHSAPAPAELLALVGEHAPQNHFRSSREREQYWRERDGRPSASASEDLFDRTNVLLGGAYGLGKSRKH